MTEAGTDARQPVVRLSWLLAIAPGVAVLAFLASCTAMLATGGFDECRERRPPPSLSSELPTVAKVATSRVERTCNRTLEVVPREDGASAEAVESALVEHFEGQGWNLVLTDDGLNGSKAGDEADYSLSIQTHPMSEASPEAQHVAGDQDVVTVIVRSTPRG